MKDNKRLRYKDGFTLIELIIIMVIFAIFIGIAIPSYMTMRNRAREAGTEAEMANIATALELYYADMEEYPSPKEWSSNLQNGGYMGNVPTKDMWGREYVYSVENSEYTLTSDGVDMGITEFDIIFSNGQQIGFGKYNTDIKVGVSDSTDISNF